MWRGKARSSVGLNKTLNQRKQRPKNKDGSGEGSFETRNRSQARTRSERHRPLHWLRLPSLSLSTFFFPFLSLMFLLLLFFQGKMVISLKNFGGKDCTTFLFFIFKFWFEWGVLFTNIFHICHGFLVQRILVRSHSASKLAKVL